MRVIAGPWGYAGMVEVRIGYQTGVQSQRGWLDIAGIACGSSRPKCEPCQVGTCIQSRGGTNRWYGSVHGRGQSGWYETTATGLQGAKAYWFLSSLAILVVDSIYQSIKVVYSVIVHETAWGIQYKEQMAQLLIELETPDRLVPTRFWLTAFVINAIVMVTVLPLVFPVHWYLVLPAILIAIPIGYGICLGGALTGTFLISAAGKLMILIFGSLTGGVLSSLWIAGVGMITIGSTEQLLVDYQVAHLTKTSPSAMFKAQLIAATVGFFVTPLSYRLFMDAFEITSDGLFTAPGGVAMRALAVIFSDGWHQLPGNIAYFVLPSVLIGLTMSILNDILPEKHARYVPNTMAFAIGFMVNGSFAINTMLGALIRLVWSTFSPLSENNYCAIIAGGMIAGEGLAAISQAIMAIARVQPPEAMAISFGVYQD